MSDAPQSRPADSSDTDPGEPAGVAPGDLPPEYREIEMDQPVGDADATADPAPPADLAEGRGNPLIRLVRRVPGRQTLARLWGRLGN